MLIVYGLFPLLELQTRHVRSQIEQAIVECSVPSWSVETTVPALHQRSQGSLSER